MDREEDIPVDATLEGDIDEVEQAVARYLGDATDASRAALLAALERLDDRTDQSDQYQNSVIGSAAIGFAAKGEVLGETSLDPVVDPVPSDELRAQVALVRAAKDEIRGPSPATFASLQAASRRSRPRGVRARSEAQHRPDCFRRSTARWEAVEEVARSSHVPEVPPRRGRGRRPRRAAPRRVRGTLHDGAHGRDRLCPVHHDAPPWSRRRARHRRVPRTRPPRTGSTPTPWPRPAAAPSSSPSSIRPTRARTGSSWRGRRAPVAAGARSPSPGEPAQPYQAQTGRAACSRSPSASPATSPRRPGCTRSATPSTATRA